MNTVMARLSAGFSNKRRFRLGAGLGALWDPKSLFNGTHISAGPCISAGGNRDLKFISAGALNRATTLFGAIHSRFSVSYN